MQRENPLHQEARNLSTRHLGDNPGTNPISAQAESEKGPYARAAERLGKEDDPDEALGKARIQARIDEHEAQGAESKARKADADARIVSVTPEPRLTPEEHGALLSGLVTKLIEGGVEPKQAYQTALQALVPGTPLPAPGTTSSMESHIVKSYFDDLRDEVKRLRTEASKPPPAPPTPPQPPDPLTEMQRIATMGETILRQVYGVTPEDIAKMKVTPTGLDTIAQLGGNMEAQIRMQEFIDERKITWARFDREQQEWKREQARKDRAADSKRRMLDSVSQGAKKISGAFSRTLEAAERKHRKEAVEETAEHTGVNPTCEKCGGELAVANSAPGWATCMKCGASCRVEEVNA